MAFDIRFLGKVSSTANSKAQTTWSYTNTADTIATIKADGYFNDAMIALTAGIGKFSVGDTIIVIGSDNHQIFSVSSVTGTVTVIAIYSKGSMFGSWEQREAEVEYIDEHDGMILATVYADDGNDTVGEINIETPRYVPRARCHAAWQSIYDMYIFAASATSLYKGRNSWIAHKGNELGNPTYIVWYIPFSFGDV